MPRESELTQAAQRRSRRGILDGIRVLDFSMYLAGPYCTRLMADLGAEVLKVEPPRGDAVRYAPPLRDERSAYFGHFNCGKKSLCLNLKTPEAIAFVKELIATSDVLLENYRPGVMERLGLDYPSIQAIKPDLIYCSVSGYGQTGPNAQRPAYAPVIHAASGHDLVMLRYDEALKQPVANRSTTADILAAIHAHAAINAALFHRAQTGEGQHMDVALMDTMHMMLAHDYQEAQFPDEKSPQVYQPIRTRDGFLMVTPVSAANFKDLVAAIGRDELASDPRFARGRDRMANWDALLEEVEKWSSNLSGSEAEARILAAGCPCSEYKTVRASQTDPQVAHRGSAALVDDGSGPFAVPNTPFQSSSTRTQASDWVADLGEHTEALMRELGHSDEVIADWRARGVHRVPESR